jgi:protein-tyrosine phosphatase
MDGMYNYRSLGGYLDSEGNLVRNDRLYRSDNPKNLSDADMIILKDLGIGLTVDLRRPNERKKDPSDLVHVMNIPECHIDLIGGITGENRPVINLTQYYIKMVEQAKGCLIEIVRTIMTTVLSSPVVFHCTAGKDRTGLVSVLLLSCLGIGRKDLIEDFLATGPLITSLLHELRAKREPEMPEDIYEAFLACQEKDIFALLDHLEEHYGGGLSYCRINGLEEDVIVQFRTCMLEPQRIAITK